eukprot:gene27210-33496_t
MTTTVKDFVDLEAPSEREIGLHASMAAVAKPLSSRLKMLMEMLEEEVPKCLAAAVRLKKTGRQAFRKRDTKGIQALEDCLSKTDSLDTTGRIRQEVSELSRLLEDVEKYTMGVGSAQPRDQEKELVRRLRGLQLPQRLVVQLNQAEGVGTEAAFRQLNIGAGKEEPTMAFAMFSQE